ncbi:MAG: hypothetical protein GX879_05115 [Bacteroidales bacterium]|nr:hypothetical protein [Bacteroidales bacterium]
MKKTNYIVFILIIAIFSCTDTQKYREIKTAFKNTNLTDTAINIDSIFSQLPDYNDFIQPLKLSKSFNPHSLHPILSDSKALQIKTNAFLLGVYITDLGYARHYEQVNICMSYLPEIQRLSSEVGIPTSQFDDLLLASENALESKDKMFQLFDSLYSQTTKYFQENEMYAIASILSAGVWTETLKIILEINFEEKTKSEIIKKHFTELETLIKVLNAFKNDEFISNINLNLAELEQKKLDEENCKSLINIFYLNFNIL